ASSTTWLSVQFRPVAKQIRMPAERQRWIAALVRGVTSPRVLSKVPAMSMAISLYRPLLTLGTRALLILQLLRQPYKLMPPMQQFVVVFTSYPQRVGDHAEWGDPALGAMYRRTIINDDGHSRAIRSGRQPNRCDSSPHSS